VVVICSLLIFSKNRNCSSPHRYSFLKVKSKNFFTFHIVKIPCCRIVYFHMENESSLHLLSFFKVYSKSEGNVAHTFDSSPSLLAEHFQFFLLLLVVCWNITRNGRLTVRLLLQWKGVINYDLCSLFLGVGCLCVWVGVLRYAGFFHQYNVSGFTICNPSTVCVMLLEQISIEYWIWLKNEKVFRFAAIFSV